MNTKEILQELITRNGVNVQLKKDQEGYSFYWTYWGPSNCMDVGETTPTDYKFTTAKHRKRFKRITDKEVLFDIFKTVKRKSRWSGMHFEDVSKVVYAKLKEVYGDDTIKYYQTKYID